jgi:hypothetical protein
MAYVLILEHDLDVRVKILYHHTSVIYLCICYYLHI